MTRIKQTIKEWMKMFASFGEDVFLFAFPLKKQYQSLKTQVLLKNDIYKFTWKGGR